jgi:hypothetical protein
LRIGLLRLHVGRPERNDPVRDSSCLARRYDAWVAYGPNPQCGGFGPALRVAGVGPGLTGNETLFGLTEQLLYLFHR